MKIIKDFILRNIAGDCILVPTGAAAEDFNGMITLSGTGEFIWRNIEKADSLDELIQMILDKYDIDENTAKREVVEFITKLMNMGMIDCSREDRTW